MVAGVRRKILVVDDDDVLRTCCGDLLAASDYDVEVAVNGKDALEKLRGSVYDLAISDINMPVLGGTGLYVRIEREYPYLVDRFVFVTGDVPQDAESKAVFSRANNMVLKKPFKPAELLAYVRLLTSVPVADYLNAEGISRRREKRHAWVADCSLSKADGDALGFFAGQTQDISKSGVRIKYMGMGLLNAGDEVFVKFGLSDLQMNGQVVWAKAFDNIAQAGLKLAEPLPVAQLLSASM